MSRVALVVVVAIASGLGCTPRTAPPAASATSDAEVGEHRAQAPIVAPEPVPSSTSWTSLEIGTDCTVRIADTPAALGAPLDWQPCEDPAERCREVATRRGADLFAPSIAAQGLAHGGQVTIAVFEFLAGPTARCVLAPRDGVPFFAIEGPRDERCSLGQVELTDDGAVVEITFDNVDGYASRAYLRGPLREDEAWRRVAAVLPRREFPSFIGESAFSVGGRVVVEQNGGPLRWFDDGTRRWVEIPGSNAGWECCAAGHGDAVTFMLETIPEQVFAARLGERAHPLRNDRVDGTSPVAIDGDRAVWIEGRERDRNNFYEHVELWAADVTPGLTLADATKISTLPRTTVTTPTFGGGVVVVPLQEPTEGLAVVRLDASEVRVFVPRHGMVVERLLWVAEDELAVQLGPGGTQAEPSRLRRIPLASLSLYSRSVDAQGLDRQGTEPDDTETDSEI
jgi:hypothetical protein